jgi:hypothetical protein
MSSPYKSLDLFSFFTLFSSHALFFISETVITHGFVLDEEGRKMSKSLGNVFDPNLTITGFPSEVPTLADLNVLKILTYLVFVF